MKSVIFTEEQLKDLESVKAALFCDANDPRSANYVRNRTRPTVSWFRIAVCLLLPLAVATALFFALRYFGLSIGLSVAVALGALTVYALFRMKAAVLCVIRIYQRYAPDRIREKCRFEPSCSEYMSLAIEKYGLIQGLKKGRGRLKRCNINGGGFDFP